MNIKSFTMYLRNPRKLILRLGRDSFLRLLSDEHYLEFFFQTRMGYELNLEDPKTFNEKLQWLKIHDRKPEYTIMVDKYEAKKYVADLIGEQYVIPTLGVWDRFEDIDFFALPEKFVLKCTHDSGGLVICREKAAFDYNEAKDKINKCLKRNYYWRTREWPYKNVVPRIIAEQYMEDKETKELRDYKFFCFNGIPKVVYVSTGRGIVCEDNVRFDFFDMKFKHLKVISSGYPGAEIIPQKPLTFEKMKRLAEKLSKKIPHVRVDFYEINKKVYFGELTFYNRSGLVSFEPAHWDKTFGDWIDISQIRILK